LLGAIAGWLTAWLTTRFRILNILAGILVMTALYSINLRIMGRPNLPLLGELTFFDAYFSGIKTLFPIGWRLVPLGVVLLTVGVTSFYILNTHWGLGLRSIGSNPRMARSQGINDQIMTQFGLAWSNGLVALGGALYAQLQGFADVGMGPGTIILGLAAVIIGEALFHPHSVLIALLGCVFGSILYRFLIAFALNSVDWGYQSSDLNLINSGLVMIFMLIPTLKTTWKTRKPILKEDL
jgi:putative ABC transport system permease protein